MKAIHACAAVLTAATLATISPAARAQCGNEEASAGTLEDLAAAIVSGLADGPTDGLSENPRIADIQKRLHGMSGMDARLSSSALLDAAFQDGRISLADAQAFVDLRTRILDAWSDARFHEDWFFGLDGSENVSPWQVDERYMEDLRLILAELGGDMDADAKALLTGIVKIADKSGVPAKTLEQLGTYLSGRPTDPRGAKKFEEQLDAAYATWNFELYKGPTGGWKRAFVVADAPDPAIRAFAERADAAGNGDGKVDLEEMTLTTLVVRLEKTFGTNVKLVLTSEGRSFARVKDGKFEIHIDRNTPAHDAEGVLAHEYGHVLLARYDQTNKRTRREREAEADFVSGWVHGKLGFALDSSGFGWVSRRWKYSAADPEHGDFRDRVEIVGAGYRAATGKDLFAVPTPSEPAAPGEAPEFVP